jgi:hypothetical protein
MPIRYPLTKTKKNGKIPKKNPLIREMRDLAVLFRKIRAVQRIAMMYQD